jgi:CRP-like cAMP-binding protein
VGDDFSALEEALKVQDTASRTKSYPAGPIFREGDRGDEMYIIKTGKVTITKNMYGIMVKIAELGPGDFFGEIAFLESAPRSSTAIAMTQVDVDVYDHKALACRIASQPEFAFGMLRAMADRLRKIDARVTDLVARGRLPEEDAAKLGLHTLD